LLSIDNKRTIIEKGKTMIIENSRLLEHVGCRAYFGKQKNYQWHIESAREESSSDNDGMVMQVVLRMSPISPRKTRKYHLKKTVLRYRDVVIWPEGIKGVSKDNGVIRYRFSRGTMTIILPVESHVLYFCA